MSYDAYAHCGNTKYEPIETVLARHRELGIVGGVLCQHFGEFDNAYIIDSARDAGSTYCAVALLDSGEPDWRDKLAALVPDPALKGVRVRVGEDRDWAEVVQATCEAGLNVVCYFRRGPDDHLDEIAALAEAHPGSAFAISHLGGSSVRFPGTAAAAWSSIPNVVLQASGFSMWPTTADAQIVDALVQLAKAYGPERTMWGSNFPVSPIQGSWDVVRSNPFGFSAADLDLVFTGTARRVWGI